MHTTTPAEIRAMITVWTDRVRATRAQEQAFLAAAAAFYEAPTPVGDPWHAEYWRTLGRAERDKADAAARYAEQSETVLSELLDQQAAADINAEQVSA